MADLTIPGLLRGGAAPAVVGVDGEAWTYEELRARAAAVAAAVRSHDTVAVVLPNGPDAALAFLGVASAAACAPLNPAYTAGELAFYLDDLHAGALVTDGCSPAALDEATRRGMAVVDLRALQPGDARPRTPTDVALVLHTSGTTGRPKQIPLTHANLCHSAANVARTLALAPEDRCVGVMPLFHIHGLVAALLASLHAGGSIVCTPGLDPARFLGWAAELGATWYTAVPTMHQAILGAARASDVRPRLRLIRSSSAPLPPTVMEELETTFDAPVIEAYGMTEASHQMASNPLPPAARKPGSVGLAAGPEVGIMDAHGTLLPAGEIGEVVVRGVTIFAGPDDWFHTGDQGVLDEDGYLTLTGRLKELVNRGGEKISPREVDEVLLEHPHVARAVAFAVPHPTLGEDIAAAIVASAPLDVDEVRAFVAARLAPHKVPQRIVVVDALPAGATGKVQRISMAERLGLLAPAEVAAEELTGAEATIAEIWAEVLGLERVRSTQRFAELGGDSLTAVTLVARVEAAFDVALPVTTPLVDGPTVAAMARLVETAPPRLALDVDPHETAVSFTQERMWVLHALDPESAAYNVPFAMRLRGELDVDRLTHALGEIVRRHEALRSTFPGSDGRPSLLVQPPAPFPLPVHDFSEAALREVVAAPFDLATGPVFRGALFRAAADGHVLLLVAHHIATDGWSRGLIRDELAALYRGDTLPDLAVGYPALAAAQRRHVAAGALQESEAAWRERLDPLPPPVLLPTDRPRSALRDSAGDVVMFELDRPLRDPDVTLFMQLLAGFVTVLHRHTGLDDVVVGVPVAGRLDPRAEGVIGPFLNTVPVRVRLDGDPTFAEVVARTRDACLFAYAHQSVPFELLVADVPRALDHAPLVQVLFQLRNLPAATAFGEDVDVHTGAAKLDLTVDVTDRGDHLVGRIEYPTALFDPATVERIGRHIATVLAADPGTPVAAIDLLDDEDRRRLAALSSGGPAPEPWVLPDRVAKQAAARPSAIAVQTPTGALTYGELIERADTLAGHLVANGAGPEVAVGVHLPRTADLVVATLGVLRAGAALVPLDPRYPAARLAAIREATAARLVIDEGFMAAIGAPPSVALPPVEPSSLAYAVTTSGSTGAPKSVLVEHRSLAAFTAALTQHLGVEQDVVFLATTPVSFDPSLRELLLPLTVGGTVVLAPEILGADPATAAALAREYRPTIVQGTPTTLRLLLDAGWTPPAGTTVLSSGEVLAPPLGERLGAAGADVWNLYGPTETTQVALTHRVTPPVGDGPIPVGRPLPGVVVEIVDARLEPVPPGLPGEVVISGSGVARGLPVRYRTGDLGRWRADGTVEYLGRIDDQMKVNGVRVEPGDIEVALAQHPAVRTAAVALRDGRLVAWVTLAAAADPAELRRHVAGLLPTALVPGVVAVVDEMPTLPNGKVDRMSLPTPTIEPTGTGGVPVTHGERRLARLWAALLGTDAAIGRDDDFFALGGSSLKAVELIARIHQLFGREVPLAQCFLTPTLAGMAAAVSELAPDAANTSSLVHLTHGDAGGPVVLWVPGAGGTTLGLHTFASALAPTIDLYGFEAAAHRGLPHPPTLEAMAAAYGDDVLAFLAATPRPFVLGGHSMGAAAAYEMARYLLARGNEPDGLVLVDPLVVRPARERARQGGAAAPAGRRPGAAPAPGRAEEAGARRAPPALVAPVAKANRRLTQAYRAGPYDGAVVLVSSREWRERLGGEDLRLDRLVRGPIESHPLDGAHRSMLADERVHVIAELVARVVDRARVGVR